MSWTLQIGYCKNGEVTVSVDGKEVYTADSREAAIANLPSMLGFNLSEARLISELYIYGGKENGN
ncbi:hypothetical protein A3J90_08415 [candidate division WOR-1 bacterium RIFOXYC2_FULL_37_10]|uniref:Uncharacterized protein n=1 Tax=candidate division WOR-1 bacterium RIFOXYB2_FULL_37_13 TaxID=1802579 RepID=A0A1F4SX68_UNCSA|nr:MAG: hypothetical protein A2246_01505 [candidate division WOR-1 bacterium RIFOXYA2_FULL_37_7]OGC24283.1 MAG: hypothetical protein A2310_08145 [candidate division WOR-1 bacterium RIFOXYB2_FULL_37_13]OGC36388.1 MAG: hypothetical protein A3J90_08415 [candidate division WOR-1 bacterium RIFOXYC2_FULL_37_10]